jgi:hypothetical protein
LLKVLAPALVIVRYVRASGSVPALATQQIPLFTCLYIKRTGNIEEQNSDFLRVLSLTGSIKYGYTAFSYPTTGSRNLLSRPGKGRFMLRQAR